MTMIGHVIHIQRVKLVKTPFEHLVIKSPYLRYILETCESEISVRIESRIESADSRLQLQC